MYQLKHDHPAIERAELYGMEDSPVDCECCGDEQAIWDTPRGCLCERCALEYALDDIDKRYDAGDLCELAGYEYIGA